MLFGPQQEDENGTMRVKSFPKKKKPRSRKAFNAPSSCPSLSPNVVTGPSSSDLTNSRHRVNLYQNDSVASIVDSISEEPIKPLAEKRAHAFQMECMYSTVWCLLQFKKKTVKLMSKECFKPVCVTGVDGFLAGWIVRELLEKGYRVRGTVQSSMDDISGIWALPNSANFTVVETSLLTPESCDKAVQGCDFVIHTGTPSSCSVRDPLSEQQEPGVHSIGSRMHCIIPMMTNFVQACARARVKRMVLTSSIAAMADSVSPNSIINETSWNVSSSLERNPHFLSLKLAEEAAWQLVDQLPSECRIDLVVINPGTLFGPSVCKGKLAPGNQIIYDLICGQYSALVDLNWNIVDVRDCAQAHILALENIEAKGRFICVNRTVWMKEIVDILAGNGYSGRALPWKVGLPNWVARLPTYATQLGQVGASLYGLDSVSTRASPYLNEKIVDCLQVKFRTVESTIVQSADDLLKWGLIKPWAEDHEAIECDCCNQPFTFYRRKHHCRECGVIICGDCSISRAPTDSVEEIVRLCDRCVQKKIPLLLDSLDEDNIKNKHVATVALESLLANVNNHDLVTRKGGIRKLMIALHNVDESISIHAAGALYALSLNISSSLQLVLEGAVLQMLEVDDASPTWPVCLQALRNIWKQINRHDFRKMLHAVARVSCGGYDESLKGNILLTFVHMMDAHEVPSLLPEGLMEVLFEMLQSPHVFPRCAAAHAIQHLVPASYSPDLNIEVPPYVVDNHEELLANSSLSDLQFLVKGSIAPINAHKVVLFFRNPYFKSIFGSTTSQKAMIEIENCSFEVFSILLRFLYTGKVNITPAIAQELLKASSLYHVYELQKRVEKFLSHEIEVRNVVDLLCLAEECNASDLKKNCVPFLLQNIHAVVRLPSYHDHRLRATDEVLKALSILLGRDWEENYINLRKKLPHLESESVAQEISFVKDSRSTSGSPHLNVVLEESPLEKAYAKTNQEQCLARTRGISDDLSECISEGIC